MLLQPFIQELLYLRDYVPAIDRPQLNLLQLLDQYRSAYPERLQGIFFGVLQDLGQVIDQVLGQRIQSSHSSWHSTAGWSGKIMGKGGRPRAWSRSAATCKAASSSSQPVACMML